MEVGVMRATVRGLVPAVALTAVLALAPAPPAPAATPAPAGTPAPGWPQIRYDAAATGFNPGETQIGAGNVGKLVTRAITPLRRPFSAASPVVADGLVIITGYYSNGGQPGLVEAFPESCGLPHGGLSCKPVWTATVTYDDSMGVTVADGEVFVNTLTESDHQKLWVFRLHCASGGAACTPLWTTTLSGISLAGQAPTVAGGVIYVPYGQPGHAYLEAFPVGCSTGCRPAWRGKLGIGADASPTVGDGFVYVPDYNSDIYAFKAGCTSAGRVCQPAWLGSVGENGPRGVAEADGLVFAGSQDGSLYAFRATGCGTGVPGCPAVWQAVIRNGANILADPAVAYGLVYVTDYVTGYLYAFPEHCSPGCQPVWKASVGRKSTASPAVANHLVYVSYGSGPRRVGIDAFSVTCATGGGTCTPLWQGHAGSYYIYSDPVVAGAEVWTGGGPQNGPANLYAFGLPVPRGSPAGSPAPAG
jgi:hypothetical protein